MEQTEPLKEELTKQGKQRQRAPGAGRPDAGRKTRLSLVSEECRTQLKEILEARGGKGSQADVIEEAVAALHKKVAR